MIRTQEWMEIKDAACETQTRSLSLSPKKRCRSLSRYFYTWLFLSLGLFHSNRKDPKGHLAQIPASQQISLEFIQITWTYFDEHFFPLEQDICFPYIQAFDPQIPSLRSLITYLCRNLKAALYIYRTKYIPSS